MNRDTGERIINATKTKERGINHLMVIGINKYEDSRFNSLKFAVKDGKEFIDILAEHYQFERENVYEFFNDNAKKSLILLQLQKLQIKVQKNDTLLIWFSGHGFIDTNERGYWIPYDAAHNEWNTYISNSAIIEAIADIKNALHTLLISDSCFSGSFFRREELNRGIVHEKLNQKKSRYAITSGRKYQTVLDESPFSSFLFRYLKDTNKAKISAPELYHEIKNSVGNNYDQIPDGDILHKTGHLGGEYLFISIKDAQIAWKDISKYKTIKSLKSFVRTYPNHPLSEIAKREILILKQERDTWENWIIKSGQDLDSFKQNFKGTEYINQVNRQIQITKNIYEELTKEEKEEEAWQRVRDIDEIFEYKKHIEQYPASIYKSDAIRRIAELEKQNKDKKAWDDVLLNIKHDRKPHRIKTVLSYYRNQHPSGYMSGTALDWIKEIEEYEILDKSDLKALKKFRNKHRNTRFQTLKTPIERQINKLELELQLDLLINNQNIIELENFLKNCNETDIKSKGNIALKELLHNDQTNYKEAKKFGTKEAFEHYLEQYPYGRNRDKAKEALKKLDLIAFEKAINGSLTDARGYLAENPNGKYISEIKRHLEKIEKERYELAVETKSIQLLEQQIIDFPDGIYSNDVRAIIVELNAEKDKSPDLISPIINHSIEVSPDLSEKPISRKVDNLIEQNLKIETQKNILSNNNNKDSEKPQLFDYSDSKPLNSNNKNIQKKISPLFQNKEELPVENHFIEKSQDIYFLAKKETNTLPKSQEEIDFEKTQSENKLPALKSFQKQYPESKYLPQVQDKIKILQLKRVILGTCLLGVSLLLFFCIYFISSQEHKTTNAEVNLKKQNVIVSETKLDTPKIELSTSNIETLTAKTPTDVPKLEVIENTSSPTKYHLIVKSFESSSRAERFLNKLKGKGFNQSKILITKKYYLVSVGSYDDEKVATRQRKILKQQFDGTWIKEWEN